MAPSMDLEVFQGKETEYNWEKREASLRNLINILRDPETNVSELIKLIGFHYQDILLVVNTYTETSHNLLIASYTKDTAISTGL